MDTGRPVGCLMFVVSEQWVSMYAHIDAHLRHCLARGFSADTTIPARRDVLERLVRAYGDLHAITSEDIEQFLGTDGWSPQTRATYWGHIRGYYRWALRAGLVPANPLDVLDRPRVPYRMPQGTNPAAFRHILRYAVEPCLTAALLAGYAGLRCCEIVQADRTDITEPPQGRIRVVGKGGRVDEIPTHHRIWVHLRGRGPGLLVRDTHGQRYRPNTLSHLFAMHMRRDLGLSDVTLHRLRHLFADTLRKSRLPDGRPVDLEMVRLLLRHRSLATTQRYLCVREEERRLAIDALLFPR